MDKISIIGAGNVGSTAAYMIAQKKLADIVLVDVVEGLAIGRALDIGQALAAQETAAGVIGTDDYKEIADSHLVIITAGYTRGPDMSRSDLVKKNAAVISQVVAEIKRYCPLTMIMVVTNPVDEMTCLTYQLSELARTTVFGMGGVLDSARFKYFMSQELVVHPKDISATVVGSHGDAMIPLVGHATVKDTHLEQAATPEEINRLVERTRNGGAEIISHLKTGSAHWAPAASVAKMAQAILLDTKAIMPCSAYLKGEYELQNVCIGIPVRLGRNGIEEFIQLDLTVNELQELRETAASFKENMALIENT